MLVLNKELIQKLSPIRGKEESEAILKQVWEEILEKNTTIHTQPDFQLSEKLQIQLKSIVNRLETREPLQYILGKAYFLNLELFVNNSVLIPRPETEELVYWILETNAKNEKSVLDLCTGSGCIALGLAQKGNWKHLAGLDISHQALLVAKQNSDILDLKIDWMQGDLLDSGFKIEEAFDIWVSNPPYVLVSEAAEMEPQVLDFEPHIALFVENDDPLLFYKKIGKMAFEQLNRGGALFFEMNPLFAFEIQKLLENLGFENVEIRKDMFGKARMIKALKPDL